MASSLSIMDIIKQRYSVRLYQAVPLASADQVGLQSALDSIQCGPFGTPLRFKLAAALEGDSQALRGMGTYGFVKNPAGFIIGAVQAKEHALEDFGYAMEKAVLEATALGLGTCWLGGLGGAFTQSGFAQKINKASNEIIPSVTAVGYAEEDSRIRDPGRQKVRADQRLPWESLFFDGQLGCPLTRSSVGAYAGALDMLRLAPTAKNKQPCRVIRGDRRWHFFCQRTPGYGKGTALFILLGMADLQRIDIGICMCHFELTARYLGLQGGWVSADPCLPLIDKNTFYIASWQEK